MSEGYSLTIKSCMAGAIFLIGLAGGTLPLLIMKSVFDDSSKKEKERRLIEKLNMFTGGVFFSSGFLHLLPEAVTDLNSAIPMGSGIKWACLFTTLGFILIILAEEGVIALFHFHDRLLHASCLDDAQLGWISDSFPYTAKKCSPIGRASSFPACHSLCRLECFSSSCHLLCHETEPPESKSVPVPSTDKDVQGKLSNLNQQDPICEAPNEMESNPLLLKPSRYDGLDSSGYSSRSFLSKPLMRSADKKSGCRSTGVAVTALFSLGIALGFHSFVEGLGLGASRIGTGYVFVAIVLHKGLAALSIGTMLSSFCSNVKVIFAVAAFSLISPLGCGVGMWILVNGQEHHDFEGSLGSGICSALAAGTFMHVSLMEIVVRNYIQSKTDRGIKLFCFLLGYSAFSALSLLV